MNLQAVETFVAVAELGSFRGAAMRLGISQPAVSQQMRRLETELGARLLDRREGTPTVAGRAFLPYARNLLEVSRQASNAVAPRRLSIGASGNIGVYLLPRYLKSYENGGGAAVKLRVAPNPDVLHDLDHGLVDLGMMEWWDQRPGFSARRFREEPLRVIVPPSHPWAKLSALSPERLLEEPMIGGERGTGTGRILRELLGPALGEIEMRYGMGSTEAVKQAVKAGLGISVVFASAVVDELRAGTLMALPLMGVELSKSLYVVTREHVPESAPAMRFAALLPAA